MKTSRIDLIALNGATGEHYKYEVVADKIMEYVNWVDFNSIKTEIIKILVENFPNE